MCDKLVFDLAQEVEGSPNVFVRKDWLNILDNQNQNYNNNQSVIDTSQLSNSNKYMSYREAYFSIPFLVTLASSSGPTLTGVGAGNIGTMGFKPATASASADHAVGLKNWFGQIIHSFTLDYNGTTIIQQTPYINMWNSFKLMTSLSLDDINTQGPTIGFYPDDHLTWVWTPGTDGAPVPTGLASVYGNGISNSTDVETISVVAGSFNNFASGDGNTGFVKRQELINFDSDGITASGLATATYGSLIQTNALTQIWKSYISRKVNQVLGAPAGDVYPQTTAGCIQYSVIATVYLKHIHSFFNMCPLLKGVFMKMTMNLNNTSTEFRTIADVAAYVAGPPIAGGNATPRSVQCTSISNPLGGVNPLMLASVKGSSTSGTGVASSSSQGGSSLAGVGLLSQGAGAGVLTQNYRMNISVGATCLDSTLSSLVGSGAIGTLSKSVYLYIPAYTFNPVFEQAYLSSPVKQIKYTDVYQYQVLNVAPNGNFNNLLTNGIANVKSVLVLPFYSSTAGTACPAVAGYDTLNNTNTGFLQGYPVWQSPFDTAGTGTTSPMCWLSNFNVQVSGQNAIYNVERYNFEQFNNQLYGQNAVNGGLTDGLTSGLISRQAFDMAYSYYYVNIERMLPVEMSVPKSIQILGQNYSTRALDLYCFVEYGCEISIDCLTGARV